MPKKIHKIRLNKEILDNLYNNEKLSSTEIGHKLNISSETILYWLKKFDIKIRSISERNRIWIARKGNPRLIKPKLLSSPELSYTLGVLLGDGCVSINEKKHRYVINLKVTDEKFANSFKNALEFINLNPNFCTIHPKPSIFNNKLIKSKKLIYQIHATSKIFSFWFKNLNLNDISEILYSENNIKEFIRGFYESEGSISKSRFAISICNTNIELLNFIKILLDKIGFNFNLRIYKYESFLCKNGKEALRFLNFINPCIKNIGGD